MENKKKFKLTNESKIFHNTAVFRIQATESFDEIKKGQLGGFVQSLDNLNGNAWIGEEAIVFEKARVRGRSRVRGRAVIYGNAHIFGDSRIYENANLFDSVVVKGNSRIFGNTYLYGAAIVDENAMISSNDDYCVFQSFGSAHRSTTFYRTLTGNVRVICGCFEGTLREFEKEVRNYHGRNKYAREYKSMIRTAKIKFKRKP